MVSLQFPSQDEFNSLCEKHDIDRKLQELEELLAAADAASPLFPVGAATERCELPLEARHCEPD